MSSSSTYQKLSAIVFADIFEYSRMMNRDETATLAMLNEHNQRLIPVIHQFQGQVIKTVGDALLIVFDSCVSAVDAAIAMQVSTFSNPVSNYLNETIRVRIGVHLGETIFQDGDVFGHGVNVTSRLQEIAKPGGICISQMVYDQLRGAVKQQFFSLGSKHLKNIAEPMVVYHMSMDAKHPMESSIENHLHTHQPTYQPSSPDYEASPARSSTPSPAPTGMRTRIAGLSVPQGKNFVVEQLESNYSRSNIDLDDFEERLEKTLKATTHEELFKITEDLPLISTAAKTPPLQRKPSQTFVCIFSGHKKKGLWNPSPLMKVIAFFGGVDLDFTEARLQPGVNKIKIFCLLGGAEIKVPPDINVEVNGLGILGGFEDKTQSVSDPDVPTPDVPTLEISGFALLGGVEVKVKKVNQKIRDMLLSWAEKIAEKIDP